MRQRLEALRASQQPREPLPSDAEMMARVQGLRGAPGIPARSQPPAGHLPPRPEPTAALPLHPTDARLHSLVSACAGHAASTSGAVDELLSQAADAVRLAGGSGQGGPSAAALASAAAEDTAAHSPLAAPSRADLAGISRDATAMLGEGRAALTAMPTADEGGGASRGTARCGWRGASKGGVAGAANDPFAGVPLTDDPCDDDDALDDDAEALLAQVEEELRLADDRGDGAGAGAGMPPAGLGPAAGRPVPGVPVVAGVPIGRAVGSAAVPNATVLVLGGGGSGGGGGDGRGGGGRDEPAFPSAPQHAVRMPATPAAPATPATPASDDVEMARWCHICTVNDAACWCADCDNEPYCGRCWRECHDDADLRRHRKVPMRGGQQ